MRERRRRSNNTHSLCVPSSLPETRICGRDYIPSAFQPQILARSLPYPFFLAAALFVLPTARYTDTHSSAAIRWLLVSADNDDVFIVEKTRGRRRWGWGGKGNGVEWRKEGE